MRPCRKFQPRPYLIPMEKIRCEIYVTGRVQGVWFRKSACAEAVRLSISGFAQNLADGGVRIEAEGSAEDVVRFVAWCRKGPPMAEVERVEVREAAPVGHRSFIVRH